MTTSQQEKDPQPADIQWPKGASMTLGKAKIIIQNGGEDTPRISETLPIIMIRPPRWWRRMARWMIRQLRRQKLYFAATALLIALARQAAPPEYQGQHFPLVLGAITSAICNSFKQELGVGTHNLTTANDQLKTALYTSTATLGAGTTAYSATNEITGTGYTAGGVNTNTITPVLSSSTVVYDLADAVWSGAAFTANGSLTYNSTKANRGIFVCAFGSDQTVSGPGTFTIQWPTADATNAIMRCT
jgi:hypothetical protein